MTSLFLARLAFLSLSLIVTAVSSLPADSKPLTCSIESHPDCKQRPPRGMVAWGAAFR